MQRTCCQILHLVEHAQGLFLRLLSHERDGSGLGEGIAGISDFAIDGKCMRVEMISSHADTSHAKHVVDILHIRCHLIVHLLQLLGVGLQLAIGVNGLCDITTSTKDTQDLVLLPSDRHQL